MRDKFGVPCGIVRMVSERGGVAELTFKDGRPHGMSRWITAAGNILSNPHEFECESN